MDAAKKAHYEKLYKDELLIHTMPFWVNNMLDKKHGGVFTSLDRTGKVYSTDKSVWMQGRTLYTFSSLLNKFGKNDEWLEIALSCKKFLDAHCFDTDGRMYFLVTEEGNALRKRRYYFSETFYVVGSAELYRFTGEKSCLEDARRVYALCRSIYLDPSSDPFKITPKGYGETRAYHALGPSMILLNVAQIMAKCDAENADKYIADAKVYADDIIKLHYKEEIKCVLENVGANGEIYDFSPADRVVNPGHAIEASWFLMELSQKTGDKELLQKALNILDWSMEIGWDKEFGGIMYFVDYKGLPVEPLESELKLWWPHNEAVIASLYAYKLTNDSKYFEMFEMLTDYCFKHFKDSEYGEWYGYLRRDGAEFKTLKGSTFKGPFHNPRMMWQVLSLLEGEM